MKKILLPLSLISVLSLAQQNTGINTTNPQATLEVASKTENTTNEVEGLLIPRVSKQKALLMAQNPTQPQESTLIYVNNLTDFVDPADGTETTVAAITENGYYHWNDSQWVKVVGKEGMPWVFNENGKVSLNQPNGFLEEDYTDKNHTIRDKNLSTYSTYSLDDLTNPVPTIKNVVEELNGNMFINKSIFDFSRINPGVDETYANLNIRKYIANNNISTQLKKIKGEESSIIVDATNTKEFDRVTGRFTNAEHHGRGTVRRLLAGAGIAISYPDATVNSLEGYYGQVSSYSDQETGKAIGITGYASQRGAGTIANMIGVYGEVDAKTALATGNITEVSGLKSNLNFKSNYQGVIENAYSLYLTQSIEPSIYNNVINNYGIHINSIRAGQNRYSIYTNAGKLRFGDLKGTGERIVTADADGVLSTSTESLSSLSSKWVYNQTNGYTKLKYLSDGITPRTGNQNVHITDNGGVFIGDSNVINNDESTTQLSVKSIDSQNGGSDSYFAVNSGNLKFGRYTDSDIDSRILLTKARGTLSDPQQPQSLDFLGRLIFNPHTGILPEGYSSNGAAIVGQLGTYNSNTDFSTMVRIITRSNGDTDMRNNFYFNEYGNFGIKTNPGTTGLRVRSSGDDSSTNAVLVENELGRELFTITDEGNTGIGNSTPTEKLDVAGDVRAENFISTVGTSVQFPDYVFQNYYNGASNLNADYDFKSLEEVETYIKQNGHLPGYVSAEEVEKAGQFDMTATQLTNVEKIEELYLHSIEQEKKLQEKEKEVKALKKALEAQKAENEAQNVRLEKLEQLLMK